ncbi:uncharacterized protein LOC112687571 [Sipha flava]|uniref:Uncharacterized protein LOC112687571 n=1 Tax=Sipha flava TaxID=143950 RepID=A0A8B8FYQ9_9HEMI|nr:uncharacterized protein LOC112687571 [Sipha flava]
MVCDLLYLLYFTISNTVNLNFLYLRTTICTQTPKYIMELDDYDNLFKVIAVAEAFGELEKKYKNMQNYKITVDYSHSGFLPIETMCLLYERYNGSAVKPQHVAATDGGEWRNRRVRCSPSKYSSLV